MCNLSQNGYQNLINAIIFQAVKDYQSGDEKFKSDVLEFLSSKWCGTLLQLFQFEGADIRQRIAQIQVPDREDWYK